VLASNLLRGSEDREIRERVAELPCLVVEEADDSALASALAENLARDDLTRTEAMEALLRLQEQYGWSGRQIAKRTGRAHSDVSELLRVARDKELAALVRDEVIAPSAAGEISHMEPQAREQVLSALDTYSGAVVLVTHDEGAVSALRPEKVILLPDGDEDAWSDDLVDLVALA